jgi:uncharacterized membrane protein YphA (DoxX/SURF4 family)
MDPATGKHIRRLLLLLGRIGLAVIFIYYSYAKMKPLPGFTWSVASYNISSASFAIEVSRYELLPDSASIVFAKLLPPFEMVLGLWLLSGAGLRFSSLCAALLLSSFIFAMVWAYVHGHKIPCGCGGAGDSEVVGPRKIIEDVLMLSVAVSLMVAAFRTHFDRRSNQTPVAFAA